MAAEIRPPRQDQFWNDYGYNAGRSRPVAVKHCQRCHDEHMALEAKHKANGGTSRSYSVRIRPSGHVTCFLCGAQQNPRR